MQNLHKLKMNQNLVHLMPTRPACASAFSTPRIKSEIEDTFNYSPNRQPFMSQNLSYKESTLLQNLKNNPDLVFKPADKGGSLIIMNKTDYIFKVKSQLQNTKYYKKLPFDPTLQIANDISTFFRFLYSRHRITREVANFLEPTTPPRAPLFYGLPKIHKPNVLLRPIVSANDSPTENISAFLDHICQPVMKSLPSYIKDTKHFFRNILELPPLPPNAILVTAYVVSLYTNIPHDEGIKLSKNKEILPPETPPLNTIKIMMDFVLKQNCFKFMDDYYQQIHGTAMGSKCAPLIRAFTWATMKILPLTTAIMLWKRFSMTDKINFLDTYIQVGKDGKLYSSLYTKPTDTFSLLHYNSFHPTFTKSSVIYSQSLRYRMLINKDDMLNKALKNLEWVLKNRGYPQKLIQENMKKIKNLSQKDLLYNDKPKTDNTQMYLVFLTHYSKDNTTIKKIINKHWHLIENDQELNKI
ncbi:uncharacterized protein LOC130623133 [Hydractinia symbiolongicarpus]|uniref:uncharacterized protein LOC130623133 n=1 Tax=Hydractinia symbiolongicarpus TaxID=13093 RepID=UPI00254F54D8|nr:uncharacterized protein LOC130623133 [Hydractinia symbiolongicarpus]